MDYRDQTFDGGNLQLDGNKFENCIFRDIVLDYSGGELTMANCRFESFSFRFGGGLANGLFALHQLFGTEGLIQIIRGFTEPHEGQVELQMPH